MTLETLNFLKSALGVSGLRGGLLQEPQSCGMITVALNPRTPTSKP